ncbi:hypothetical protein AMS68_001318 [Peltaster fructicola]|uniref:Repressor of RNA polymerase III transcription MAF1 n=1 Tax=Peltaster fructicola TaxID=286661 RepID=A0A6H0XMD4_9PEZI|nr:hypothetical protein AMS68_001318 [Peltaster fructicola]
MKYLPLRDIDTINNAINFSTQDLHIIGMCDVYTLKAAGGDKKLYKYIEEKLETKHQELLDLAASLSPPASEGMSELSKKDKLAASATPATPATPATEQDGKKTRKRSRVTPEIDLSRDTAFGSFTEMSARRTFAYLIATLNAAHPDYDFSYVLRPEDFKKERSLRTIMNNVDSTMQHLRPKQTQYLALPSSHSSMVTASNDIWSARMWTLLDNEMSLQDCEKYSYAPAIDPLYAEEGAIWTMHYFFFNKRRKRVCYFHIRALSVISHSPVYKHLRDSEGAGKRASYWLGDKAGDAGYDEDMEYLGESSDDEDVDRIRYSDLDQIRNGISQGYWGCADSADLPARGPGSVTDEIGASMEI